jgi:2-phospho-L-lactate guanylyltransferase
LQDGKRRLAPVLDVAERTALVRWLMERTLACVAEFPGWSRTLVVTACREVSACVGPRTIHVLEEAAPGGLNDALRQARRAVAGFGGSRMLVVSCDLPLLHVSELRQLAGAATDDVVALAPDRANRGTNAMCLPVAPAFEFAFGADSFSRHRQIAELLGLETVTVRSRGLAFDVDLPGDLSDLHEALDLTDGSPPWTSAARRPCP